MDRDHRGHDRRRRLCRLACLHELHALGVKIALDDFGSGYASLAYVRRLPLDLIKLDRSLVRGAASGFADAHILAAAIEMARALGLEVVAEGCETAQQLASCRRSAAVWCRATTSRARSTRSGRRTWSRRRCHGSKGVPRCGGRSPLQPTTDGHAGLTRHRRPGARAADAASHQGGTMLRSSHDRVGAPGRTGPRRRCSSAFAPRSSP